MNLSRIFWLRGQLRLARGLRHTYALLGRLSVHGLTSFQVEQLRKASGISVDKTTEYEIGAMREAGSSGYWNRRIRQWVNSRQRAQVQHALNPSTGTL